MEHLALATLVLVIILLFNCLKNPMWRNMGGIAIGLVGIYCGPYYKRLIFLHWKISPNHHSNSIQIWFFFDWHAFFIAATIYLLSVFEAVGDLTATALVSNK